MIRTTRYGCGTNYFYKLQTITYRWNRSRWEVLRFHGSLTITGGKWKGDLSSSNMRSTRTIIKKMAGIEVPSKYHHSWGKECESGIFQKTKSTRSKLPAPTSGLVRDATNLSKRHKPIGPLKRDDGSLAVCDVEKADLMNACFSSIGATLEARLLVL